MTQAVSRIAFILIAACMTNLVSAPEVHATPFEFEWHGTNGYSVIGSFGFDPLTAPPIITESGSGPTNFLEFLTVSFLDPANTVMQTFDTVAGGVSNSPFLAFNFDTTTNTLFGPLNVGGGSVAAGVQFFNGDIGGLLRLRENTDPPGTSVTLDSQQPGTVAVTAVPEPGSLMLTGLGAAVIFRRAFRRPTRR
jgi:hypothetical protein